MTEGPSSTCEVTVTLTFDLKSNQFILESEVTFLLNLKEIPSRPFCEVG